MPAIDAGNQALVLLLLANGHDANGEAYSQLDLVLRARRFDLLILLLDWGADPHRVDPDELFGTYNSELFERFYALGVDLTADHALAHAIAHHTSNKPLLGFAKRHRETDARFQKELDIALAHLLRRAMKRVRSSVCGQELTRIGQCLVCGMDARR